MQSRSLVLYGLILLIVIALAGLGWANYRYASQSEAGNSFLVYWISIRALTTEGQSPYSPAMATRIQDAIRERSGGDSLFTRVTFPLYSLIFTFPLAFFNDGLLAQAFWMVILEGFLILFAVACVRLAGWRMTAWNLVLYALFVLTWFHSLIVLHEGSIVILVALLLAWGLLAIRNGVDELAGGLLALATIRPLLVILPLVFILLWAGAQNRWKLIAWFTGVLVLLSLGSMFFIQDWLLQNIQAVFASLESLAPMTPGEAFTVWWPGVGSRLGWILTFLLSLILLAEWWLAIRAREFGWFLWTACLTLVFGQWIGIRTEPVNYILLLLPLTLVFAVWDERWRRREHLGRMVIATVLSMILLGPGLWAFFWNVARQGQNLTQMAALLFPLPLFLIITMYWVRWWAIRPQRLYVEALREGEAA